MAWLKGSVSRCRATARGIHSAEFSVRLSAVPGLEPPTLPHDGRQMGLLDRGGGGGRSSDEQRSDHHCDGRTALDGVEWTASAFDGVWRLLRLYCRPAGRK